MSRAPRTPPRRADRGLTLIELVVATAIFALVAVMATQALTGGLIQRRVLSGAADQAAALARTLTLLRQDLETALPLPHLPAAGPQGAPIEALATGGFALSRAAADGGLARVVWRVDPGRSELIRASAPLTGADRPGDAEALLPGVVSIRLIPRGEAPEGGLPPGLEAVIETGDRGTLRVVVAR
jgi:general secretion pathway protein J